MAFLELACVLPDGYTLAYADLAHITHRVALFHSPGGPWVVCDPWVLLPDAQACFARDHIALARDDLPEPGFTAWRVVGER